MADFGRLQGVLYIHNAILGETSRLEERLSELDHRDEAELQDLKSDFEFLMTMTREHEGSEEKIYFPGAREKMPYLTDPYIRDHREHEAVEDRLLAALESLTEERATEDRGVAAERAYREGVALNSLMHLHITKENELAVPAMNEELSDEELDAMNDRLPEAIPPEVMQEMIPWMFRWQSVDDKVGMTRELMRILPVEAKAQVGLLLAGVASKEVWAEVVDRVPGLPSDARDRG